MQRPQIKILFQNALLFYCTLYTYSPGGSTDAATCHVRFAQVTCDNNKYRDCYAPSLLDFRPFGPHLNIWPHQPNFACYVVSRISFLILSFRKISWKKSKLWMGQIFGLPIDLAQRLYNSLLLPHEPWCPCLCLVTRLVRSKSFHTNFPAMPATSSCDTGMSKESQCTSNGGIWANACDQHWPITAVINKQRINLN